MEEQKEGIRAALLNTQALDSLSLDWLGKPAGARQDLGGWKCGFCILGAVGLVYAVFFSVLSNLVVYLVRVLDYSNDVAAKTVTNLAGTAFLSSFIGALVSDAYLGRLWASIAFAFLSLLGFTLSSVAAQLIAEGIGGRIFFLTSQYIMVVAIGSTFPNMISLGADQLNSSVDKAKYFTLLPMIICVSQFFATTLMTYLDNLGMWVLGFWLCTGASGLALALIMAVAWTCRQCRASGNPIGRITQVLVVVSRNWNCVVPSDSSLLYEVDGDLSAIPGCRKLRHTSFLSFLDKAAIPIPAEQKDDVSAWRLCTVTQVEEVKCLIRILPVGVTSTCIAVVGAQLSTLFVEQASAMNMQVGGIFSAGVLDVGKEKAFHKEQHPCKSKACRLSWASWLWYWLQWPRPIALPLPIIVDLSFRSYGSSRKPCSSEFARCSLVTPLHSFSTMRFLTECVHLELRSSCSSLLEATTSALPLFPGPRIFLHGAGTPLGLRGT
ncbi:hypothetical protein GOP47_0020138 [Adiantum capillus-veneris]|uniref:Uncharacterized protein n=1 Tax=Adiantum capillus-veneris TaxID=13818 RepID=A0A9D4UCE5_ADICA|nr:hypothetical protein GOP47_0020138 [Adiantum capillus-veneris]